MGKLWIDDERISEGRVDRYHLSQHDRAISIMDLQQEAATIASMRR